MKTREQLIADYQGLVRSLAWQIHCKLPPQVDLEDLVGYGQIGLIEAAQAFDPSRENQFSTYSYYRIRGAILDGLSKMSWFNRASFNGGEYEQQRLAARRAQEPEPEPDPEPEDDVQPEKSPEQMIADSQGLVRSLAWQIQRKLPASVELAELVGYGQAGVAEAARLYLPSDPNQFSTHCYQFIRDAIFRGLSKYGWFNRADYHGGVYEHQPRPPAAPPSPANKNASRISCQCPSDVSGAAGLVWIICGGFAGGDAEQAGVGESGQPTPLDVAMQQEMVEKLHVLIEALPEPARDLIHAAYFEGLTLKDAGERMGMSKAWASRLHAKTLDQLAQSFRVSRMAD